MRKTDESLLLLTWSRHRIDRRGNHVAEDYPNDGHAFDRHIDRLDRVPASLSALEEGTATISGVVSAAEAGGHCLQAVK